MYSKQARTPRQLPSMKSGFVQMTGKDKLQKPTALTRNSACIEVTGFARGFKRTELNNYMNKLAKVVSSEYEAERNVAYFTFKERDGKELYQNYLKTYGERLQFDKQDLRFRLVNMDLCKQENPYYLKHSTHALHVTGFSDRVSEWKLKNTLCNHREAIGDKISSVYFDRNNHSAVVTFEKPEAAEQVLKYHDEEKTLEIDGNQLGIKMMFSQFRPCAEIEDQDLDNCLFVKGFSDDVSAKDIEKHLASSSKIQSWKFEKIVFGPIPGTALLYYNRDQKPDYTAIYKKICTKPLLGKMIEVEMVHRSSIVEVYAKDSIQPLDVRRYLFKEYECKNFKEFKRNHKGCIPVRFDQPSDADRVTFGSLKKSIHSETVIMKIHHECLGWVPPDHNTDEPAFEIPKEKIFNLPEDISKFVYEKRNNYQTMLNEQVKDLYGVIDGISENGVVCIKCLITRETEQFKRKSKAWNSDMYQQFNNFKDSFVCRDIQMPQKTAKNKKIESKIPMPSEKCDVKVNWHASMVTFTGEVAAVEDAYEVMRNVIDRFERIKTGVYVCPDHNHLQLLLKLKALDELEIEYEDMEINKRDLRIEICGVDTEVASAKERLQDIIKAMGEHHLTFKPMLQKLYKHIHHRTEDIFKQFTCIYEITENGVYVLSESVYSTRRLVEILNSKILEEKITIPGKCIRVVKSTSSVWNNFSDNLRNQTNYDLIIDISDSMICFAATGNEEAIHAVHDQIMEFMKDNEEVAWFYDIPTPVTKYVELWLMNVLQEIGSCQVDVHLCEDGPGLIVCGAPTDVEIIKDEIQDVLKEVQMKKYIISQKYGMPKYFASEHGKTFLEHLQTQQVLIEVETDANRSYQHDKKYNWIHIGNTTSGIQRARVMSARLRKMNKIDINIGSVTVHVNVNQHAFQDSQPGTVENNQLAWKGSIRKVLDAAIEGKEKFAVPFKTKENTSSALESTQMAKIFAACLTDIIINSDISSKADISIVCSCPEDKAILVSLLQSLNEKHTITFHLFGTDTTSIEQVKEEILEKCNQHSKTLVLPKSEYGIFVNNANAQQRQEIQKLEGKLPVKVTIHDTITIKGLETDCNKVKTNIDRLLHQEFDARIEMVREQTMLNMSSSETPAVPDTWTDSCDGTDQTYSSPLVELGSLEYQYVVDKFITSLGRNPQSIKVCRIQNNLKHKTFEVRKRHMVEQNGSGIENERLLWHGTSGNAVQEINSTGFNRSFCGQNGTAYGKGVYFAVDATYSDGSTYSPPDPNDGYKHMYLSRVLTGVYTKGHGQMKVPPNRTGTVKYDSVVNHEENPSMFIVFYDDQAYPQYLIKYK